MSSKVPTGAFYKHLVPPRTASQTTGPLQRHPRKLRRSSFYWMKSRRGWSLKTHGTYKQEASPHLRCSWPSGRELGDRGMLLSNLWNHISKTYGTDKEIIMVSMGWFYELRIVSHFGTKDRKKERSNTSWGFWVLRLLRSQLTLNFKGCSTGEMIKYSAHLWHESLALCTIFVWKVQDGGEGKGLSFEDRTDRLHSWLCLLSALWPWPLDYICLNQFSHI